MPLGIFLFENLEVELVVNMNDVAKLAGVSRGSVSNYINGKKTKLITTRKIERAISSLDYIPNAMARSLKTQKSNFVVFIVPTVNSPFFSEITFYIQQALQEKGYKMILCNSNNISDQEIDYIRMANMQKVAGLITISYANASNLIKANVPVVSIEKHISDNVPVVVSDNYQGGRLAAEILAKKGAKRLLFISRRPVINISAVRERGFFDYCNDNNINVSRFFARKKKNFILDFKDFIVENIHNQRFSYDGIFSDSDEYAGDFYNLLIQKGINIPNDVQIIGFDGARVYSRQKVLLSSIRQQTSIIAKESVRHLIQHIEQIKVDDNECIVPISFVQGATTK